MIFRRSQESILAALLQEFPVVGILGPRQVGKTTLAKMLIAERPGAIYLDLELPSDLNKLREPELYLQAHKDELVVIDEVQRKPEIFPVFRALVDQQRRPGRFLILGSSSKKFKESSSESLAGRIVFSDLSGLNALEIRKRIPLETHWWRGGYPNALLAADDSQAMRWLEALISAYLERDLPLMGIRIPPPQLRRFWTMLAHTHGQMWNASQMASNFGVSAPTVGRYLDALEEAYLVSVIRPWHVNLKKRLVKSPRIFIRDSGILHSLLGIRSFEALQAHPQLGASWEGYVLEQILAVLPRNVAVYFYRTHAGAEIDFLLARGDEVSACVEVKNSSSPRPSRGMTEARRDLGNPPGWMIYRGTERYSLSEAVTAISLEDFLSTIM